MAGREREVEDEVILKEIFIDEDPVFVAKEIAESLNMSRQGIDSRLRQLEHQGLLTSKKPGRDRIYWLTEDGRAMAQRYLQNS